MDQVSPTGGDKSLKSQTAQVFFCYLLHQSIAQEGGSERVQQEFP